MCVRIKRTLYELTVTTSHWHSMHVGARIHVCKHNLLLHSVTCIEINAFIDFRTDSIRTHKVIRFYWTLCTPLETLIIVFKLIAVHLWICMEVDAYSCEEKKQTILEEFTNYHLAACGGKNNTTNTQPAPRNLYKPSRIFSIGNKINRFIFVYMKKKSIWIIRVVKNACFEWIDVQR